MLELGLDKAYVYTHDSQRTPSLLGLCDLYGSLIWTLVVATTTLHKGYVMLLHLHETPENEPERSEATVSVVDQRRHDDHCLKGFWNYG
jgi:hypothetical protein